MDELYTRLLSGMYLEDNISLRLAYASCLPAYLAILDRSVIKHLQLSMKVILSYLEDSDGSQESTR